MTDKDFINKVNEGDLSAFRVLYQQYYAALCIYARRFTKNKDVAEEVVQEVFLRLWEKKGQPFITCSLESYLYTAVRNQCLDHLKHLQVVQKFNSYYSRLLQEAEDYYFISQESGDSIFIAHELEKSVTDAIDALPDQCRRIFVMSRYEGIKHQEIADHLGVTINTVQRQVSIALEKLRNALKNYLVLFLILLKMIIA